MKFLLLLVLAKWVIAIDQSCITSQQCPTNAYCQPNDMCACNVGFIGSCSTSAYFLTQDPINVVLNSGTTTYFYVDPEQLNTFIQTTFQICLNQPSQVNIVLTLWGQTGDNTVYTVGNALGSPTSATLTPGCQQFTTSYITFDTQPNGQNQMLVLGITTGSISASVSISAQQEQVSAGFIYYYVIVAIVAVVVIVIIVGVVVCMVRKRRRNLANGFGQALSPPATRPTLNNIEHFQNLMPKFYAQNLGPQKVVCTICLQLIELNEMVRQTPCRHSFHSACIDSWCLKNLTCPICRTDLTLQSMMQQSRKNSSNSATDRVQFYEQPLIQPQPVEINNESVNTEQRGDVRNINFDEQKYEIRQHML